MSGAVYSTNSKPSVPIGLANPVAVFFGNLRGHLQVSFAGPTALAERHFKAGGGYECFP